MEENTWDAAAPAPLTETIDTLPEGANEALAKLDAGIEVLQGVDWTDLSPGELRATLREIVHLQTRFASIISAYQDHPVTG